VVEVVLAAAVVEDDARVGALAGAPATPMVVRALSLKANEVTLKPVVQSQSPPKQQKLLGEQNFIEFPLLSGKLVSN
jgi:hypothetical protein